MSQTCAYEIHEAANLFPIDEEHLQELADDIRDNGQQVPIELFHGKIVDGRRRYRACEIAGVEPVFRDVYPSDPIAYVVSLNLHRRHLTPSQLAMVAARVRDIYDRQAKERQKLSEGRGKKGVENLPHLNDSGKARDQAGKMVGVSGKSVDHATKVLKHAVPEVIKAVDEGRMAVSTAAILATDPPEVQVEEATNPKRRRTYQSVSGDRVRETSKEEVEEQKDSEPMEIKERGVGVAIAYEAINVLQKCPKKDPLRRDGFQKVIDWAKHNM